MDKSRSRRIFTKLSDAFKPYLLKIDDESYKHAGHKNREGKNFGAESETHFRVRIGAESFQNKRRVMVERMIHEVLSEEWKSGLHALSIEIIESIEKGNEFVEG